MGVETNMQLITYSLGAFLPFIHAVPQKIDRKTRVYDASEISGSNFAVFSDPQIGMLDSYERRIDVRIQLGLNEERGNGSLFHNELGYVQKTVEYLNTQQ